MFFWLAFFIIVYLILSASLIGGYRLRQIFFYLLLGAIWFVGAFRKDIGVDYSSYERIFNDAYYYGSGYLFSVQTIEKSFAFFVWLFTELNLDSQVIFILYESFTIFGIYYGLKKYNQNPYIMVVTLTMYVLIPDSGYWSSLSYIRQAAAASIAFWATGMLYQEEKNKCYFCFLMAVFFHISAIIIFPIVLMQNKIIKLKFIIPAMIMGFLFNATGVSAELFIKTGMLITGVTGNYETIMDIVGFSGGQKFSLMAFCIAVVYLFLYKCDLKRNENNMIVNGAAVYTILRIYTSFGGFQNDIMSLAHRFELYYLPFFLLYIGIVSWEHIEKNMALSKICVLVLAGLFIVSSLNFLDRYGKNINAWNSSLISQTNINYRLNIKVFH